MHCKRQEHAWSDRPSLLVIKSITKRYLKSFFLPHFRAVPPLTSIHVFQVHEFPCLPHLPALVHVHQMKGNLTQTGEGKGSHKCPSQIQRCLIIQALEHFTFLPKPPISFFFFCSMSKMTTTYFTRWICSKGIVTDATLPRKITFRLSTQNLIRNKCLPICRHSPVRCCLLKPTEWFSFVTIFQSFSTYLDLMTALNIFLCTYRTYLSSKGPKSHINRWNSRHWKKHILADHCF